MWKTRSSARKASLLRNRLLLAIGGVIALVLSMGQPAMAAPYWQTYTYTSSWHCSQLSTNTSVAAVSSCVVVNGNYSQAVVVVTNKTSGFIDLQSSASYSEPLRLYKTGSMVAWDACLSSSLGGGLSRACFGETISGSCGSYVQAWAAVDYRLPGNSWSTTKGFSPSWALCS